MGIVTAGAGLPFPELADAGLQLQAVLSLADMDVDVTDALFSAGFDVGRYQSLVMLGHVGSTLWEKVVRFELERTNPFDEVVIELLGAWFGEHHPEAEWEVLYPGTALLPLGRLAESAGWGSPSPLGLTVHPEHGLWMAHRVVALTNMGFDWAQPPAQLHPCDTCDGRPCESACPVGAVSFTAGFDIRGCGGHRIATGSECAYQCLARIACPIGALNRYVDDQMRYHYGIGLASIRVWLNGE